MQAPLEPGYFYARLAIFDVGPVSRLRWFKAVNRLLPVPWKIRWHRLISWLFYKLLTRRVCFYDGRVRRDNG